MLNFIVDEFEMKLDAMIRVAGVLGILEGSEKGPAHASLYR